MIALRCAHILLIILGSLSALGCDPVTRHKVLSTVFDGVPSLPPPEELCREHEEKLRNAPAAAETPVALQQAAKSQGSRHEPYAERRCNDCHMTEGQVSSGLIKPKNELCFICHPDILDKPWAHGPAAVGDCLACHEPHESGNQALLSKPRGEICAKCHRESRLAAAMHTLLAEKEFACADCHDPHAGTSEYFLK